MARLIVAKAEQGGEVETSSAEPLAEASRKLSHKPEVVASYRRAGVPEDKLNILAFTRLPGVVGLLGGLVWAPIDVTAAGCLTGYSALATVAHLRANDAANLPTPLVLAILAAATLALRLASNDPSR